MLFVCKTLFNEPSLSLLRGEITQILITVIEEEGEKYNLDYHEGNVLITRISPGIFKTVLIDFGIIMDIPKLLSITNDLVKQQELQQYISNIKGVINTITQNKTISYRQAF